MSMTAYMMTSDRETDMRRKSYTSARPAVVTITVYPSMPWCYKVMMDGWHLTDTGDAGCIAAAALNAGLGAGHYVIIGPEEVMQHIPPHLRSSKGDTP